MPSPTMSIASSAAGAMPDPERRTTHRLTRHGPTRREPTRLGAARFEGRRGEDIMQGSLRALALIALCSFAATPLHAQSPADFYKGKQIRMVGGTEAGQDYDTWARLVARHMRRYVPGNPAFVVENMPGAGSLIAANHLYNKAAQDGTTLGMVSRNIPNYARI